ncbi:MAG: ABC transporter permease, partial [Propionibacteriaceae bacterium]|nr:ABC transporter permease [Propionibacteriaceae bacterium]
MTGGLSTASPRPAPARAERIPVGVWLSVTYLVLIALALAGPGLLAAGDPTGTDPLQSLRAPSAEHWFGTDQLGRDLYSRVVHGARYSVIIALLAVSFAVIAGTVLGLLAGMGGRLVDETISRVVDLLSAFPSILVALVFAVFLGRGIPNL